MWKDWLSIAFTHKVSPPSTKTARIFLVNCAASIAPIPLRNLLVCTQQFSDGSTLIGTPLTSQVERERAPRAMVGADTSQTDTDSSTPLQMWSPTTTTAPLHQLCYNNQMKNMACSPTITRTYSAAFAHYDDITYVPACLGNHIIPSATSGALLHLLQDVVFGGQKPSVGSKVSTLLCFAF